MTIDSEKSDLAKHDETPTESPREKQEEELQLQPQQAPDETVVPSPPVPVDIKDEEPRNESAMSIRSDMDDVRSVVSNSSRKVCIKMLFHLNEFLSVMTEPYVMVM